MKSRPLPAVPVVPPSTVDVGGKVRSSTVPEGVGVGVTSGSGTRMTASSVSLTLPSGSRTGWP